MRLSKLFDFGHRRPFAEGQVWAYQAREDEPGSTLKIQKIEDHPEIGPIIHITICDLRIKNPAAAAGVSTEMAHAPVAGRTLEASCTRLIDEGEPDGRYVEGYTEWKRAFDAGHAGVFTISVAEIVDGIEAAMQEAGGDAP